MSNNRVEKISYDFVSPFGPNIMIGDIPDSIYEEFSGIVHKVIKEKGETHTARLSGRLDEEWSVGKDVIFQTRTEEFLDNIVNRFCLDTVTRLFSNSIWSETKYDLDSVARTPMTIQNEGGWVNNMKSYEYNPIHYHPFCNITSVFYFDTIDDKFLKKLIAPKNVKNNYDAPDSDKGTTEDGILEIVYNSTNYFETGTMRIVPKEKMFLVFPSYLLHMVYPFISDKTRVSASFNFRVSSDLQQINYGER